MNMRELAKTVIRDLNNQNAFFETKDQKAIEALLESTFKKAFEQADTEEKKKTLYRALSREVHPDHPKADFIYILKNRNMDTLAFQVLNVVNNPPVKPGESVEEDAVPAPAPAPTNLWSYVESKQTKLLSTVKAAVKAQNTIPPLPENMEARNHLFWDTWKAELKINFPALYEYERYYTPIQRLAYMTSFSINMLIVSGLLAKTVLSIAPAILHYSIEAELLRMLTNGQYQHYVFESQKLPYMRQVLEEQGISMERLSTDDIIAAYDNVMQNGKESQLSFLEGLSIDITHLTNSESDLMFKQLYIAKTVDQFLMNYPELANNADVMSVHDTLQLNHISTATNENQEQVRDILTRLGDTAVNHAYAAMRKAQHDFIMKQLPPLEGMQHLNAVMKSLQDAWNAGTHFIKGGMQLVLFIAILPLLAIKLLWDGFSAAFDALCILLKVASVMLVNLPLTVHDYFYPKPEETPVPVAGEQPSNDPVPKADTIVSTHVIGLFSSRERKDAVPIQPANSNHFSKEMMDIDTEENEENYVLSL